MARRSPARFIAPLALVAAVVATILVVQADRPGDGSTTTTNSRGETVSTTDTTSTTGTSTTAASGRKRRKVYVVKPGDILSTVSEQTGLTVDQLEQYNPGLDPQSLQVGQKIKLAPSGSSAAGSNTTTIP